MTTHAPLCHHHSTSASFLFVLIFPLFFFFFLFLKKEWRYKSIIRYTPPGHLSLLFPWLVKRRRGVHCTYFDSLFSFYRRLKGDTVVIKGSSSCCASLIDSKTKFTFFFSIFNTRPLGAIYCFVFSLLF